MEKYRILGKKGEGTFSEVLKCQNLRDGTYWAVKKMKQVYKSMEEVQQIREIRVLKLLNGHPNIIFLREIIFDKRMGVLCLIFELMSMNLYEYIRGRQRLLSNDIVCRFMYQLLKALEHLHRHGYFHRDIKPENILIKDDVLKLADFGSCRQTTSKPPLTEYISTRWYRAPECLLTDGYYRNQMDLWSAGCVMYEILTLRPLFPGSNELDQLSRIHDVLGTPSASTLEKFQHRNSAVDFNFPSRRGTGIARQLSHCSPETIDLVNQLCVYDPDLRISAAQALRHPYFDALRTEENRAPRERTDYVWDYGTRKTRTNDDRVIRSGSSSSQSSVDEPITSTRSNIHNSSSLQHQVNKPDLRRSIYPSIKAQSLIEARAQVPATKKPTIIYRQNPKTKTTQANYLSPNHQNQSYYSSLSINGGNGSDYPSPTVMQMTKTGPPPFLPRISGASAFSNYSATSGYASKITNKTNYSGKNLVTYYPIIPYRTYKK